MKENRRLREELAEATKENLFLKKWRHSSQRESTRSLSVHRRISGSVRYSVTAATFKELSECLLQPPEAQTAKEAARKRDTLHQIQTI